MGRLIKIIGDVSLAHVRTDGLNSLRDDLIGTIKAASLHAIFEPIKGFFGFAFDEGIISESPMIAVLLPRDKRPIEERKWKPFSNEKMRRLSGRFFRRL